MTGGEQSLWVYLASSPLLALTATLVVLGAMLELTGISYATYFDGAQFIHFLLGPATVALAVPLHRQADRSRGAAAPILAAVVVGGMTAIASATTAAWALGAARETIVSLAPKSVTTPVAMALSERLGGVPSLTAALVVLAGITGAVVGPPLARAIGARDPRDGGALGVASHGIGTARALQISETMGAFSGLGSR